MRGKVHVMLRVDAAVKGRALPDDGKLDAKDAGEAGTAEDDVNSYLCSNSARERIRSLSHHGLLSQRRRVSRRLQPVGVVAAAQSHVVWTAS